jgi:hypothetical protein
MASSIAASDRRSTLDQQAHPESVMTTWFQPVPVERLSLEGAGSAVMSVTQGGEPCFCGEILDQW